MFKKFKKLNNSVNESQQDSNAVLMGSFRNEEDQLHE